MPTVLQFRRGTTAQNNSFTGAAGEISIDTTLDTLRVHDGSTAGGLELTQNTATQTLTNKTLTSPTVNTPTITGDTTFSDGAYDFDVASHDGSNGLKLGGTLVTSTAAELNLLDGVSGLVQADLTKLAAVDATAAELNIMDGDTSATSTTLADADRLVTNDNGTMVQVALSDVKTYLTSAGFSSEDPTALAIALG